jgi:hypothetical protein
MTKDQKQFKLKTILYESSSSMTKVSQGMTAFLQMHLSPLEGLKGKLQFLPKFFPIG